MFSSKKMFIAGTGKESTTKAGQFWQLLHTEREFSAAYLQAALENDDQKYKDALEIIDMTPDDVKLSDEEFLAFAHGLTPSGELEVTAWEGYYLTDPLPNGEVFALLICSFDNGVYWGPEEGFLDHYWSKCQVDYHLGPHATLCFSSSSGDVTLSFSRDFDKETGEFGNTTAKGTAGATEISATRKSPPLPKGENTTIFAAQRSPPLPGNEVFPTDSTDPEEEKNFLLGDRCKTITSILGIAGTITGLILWCCPGLRYRCYRYAWEWRRIMSGKVEYVLSLKEGQLSGTQIDLSRARPELKLRVVQALNKILRGAKFDEKTIDEIIGDSELNLQKSASDQLKTAIETYIKDRLRIVDRQNVGDMPGPELARRLEEGDADWIVNRAEAKSEVIMETFETDPIGIVAIVRSTVMENRKEFYRNQAQGHTRELEEIDGFLRKTSEDIERWGTEVKELDEKARQLEADGKAKEADWTRQRKINLEYDIDRETRRITEKEAERTGVDTREREAERKAIEYDKDIEDRKNEWDKEAEKHIK